MSEARKRQRWTLFDVFIPRTRCSRKWCPPFVCRFFVETDLFTYWPPSRVAAKYFQLAAFVMLIYDHSKLMAACRSTRATHWLWVFPSANVWPGGISVLSSCKPCIELLARSIASGNKSSPVPRFYSWLIDISRPFNLLLFWLVSPQIFSLMRSLIDGDNLNQLFTIHIGGLARKKTCILCCRSLTSLQMR